MKSRSFYFKKPPPSLYQKLVPELSADECSRQVEFLPGRYFLLFSMEKLRENAKLLASLSVEKPYHCVIEERGDGQIELAIITFDMDSLFSLAAGVLSAGGFDIQSGDIFTYRSRAGRPDGLADGPAEGRTGGPSAGKGMVYGRRSAGKRPGQGQYRRQRTADGVDDLRKVVDVFRGTFKDLDETGVFSAAASIEELRRVLDEVFSLLFTGWPPDIKSSRRAAPKSSLDRAKEKTAEELARRLVTRRENLSIPKMFPMDLEVRGTEEGNTILHVRSQDTPFFLYAFGTVLSVHGISIEHVEIKTTQHAIEDTFHVRAGHGGPVTDSELLNSLKLSVLFTKQFTYFLWNAPDPYRALLRFETLLKELRTASDRGASVTSLIADEDVLKRLSRLLGASDFIWEDFIRLQYENIIPLLTGSNVSRELDVDTVEMRGDLKTKMAAADGFEEKKRVLNEFKDWFTYLSDLRHIIDPEPDLSRFNTRLTEIAEIVVRGAFEIAWDHLLETYGTPRTVANLPVVYAVSALGKFGGKALGYASDIELLVIYRDAGETDGPRRISSAEFFSALVRTASLVIESKQEGIYRVDLRLRPHGSRGPLAVHLSRFLSYYRHEASSLEKLALVRLRAVAGDADFGAQVERLRDAVLYESGSIDVDELVRLRRIQAEKYTAGDSPNVKYGPGGLVDLEYCVQTLQVMDGRKVRELRTPYMQDLFKMLSELGTLDHETSFVLETAYLFLRRLLNALRMLRGNALDLCLPPRGSSEFFHLARRMGYREKKGVPGEEQLWIDFQKNTAMVRTFVEHQLGSQAVILRGPGTIADLLLADQVEQEQVEDLFSHGGFSDSSKAFANFSALSMGWKDRTRFIELALFAWDYLQQSPDPDMALNNWERFSSAHPDPGVHFNEVYRQPKRLEILLRICAASQYLADLLMRNPEFFSIVTDPDMIQVPMSYGEFYHELSEIRHTAAPDDSELWRRELRVFRHKYILRIGSRDICYGAPLEEIVAELSALAEAVVQAALDFRLRAENPQDARGPGVHFLDKDICILAFGKLGGKELNYSSDIDLVVLFQPGGDEGAESERKRLRRIVQQLRSDIADVTENGRVYRVDFRLRPYGRSGDLVFTSRQMEDYYDKAAALWEFQALLKARPVAGNRVLGNTLLRRLYRRSFVRMEPAEIIESVRAARRKDSGPGETMAGINIKEAAGGLRDIEFLVQALQLIYAGDEKDLICGHTLDAVNRLRSYGHLDETAAAVLGKNYHFLRRVEHFLQLLEDLQEHTLPVDPAALERLSGRMRWTRICPGGFETRLKEIMFEVRNLFNSILAEERALLETGRNPDTGGNNEIRGNAETGPEAEAEAE